MYECTVSELNCMIKDVLYKNVEKQIQVTGELSSVKQSHRHVWLTVKDNSSSITCVFWNCTNFKHKDGDKVKIKGRIAFYEKTGVVNFIGSKIESIGIGELYRQYQENYEKFKKKGYFDNKKNLPTPLNSVGVLTAKDGAALQDLLYVLKNNGFKGRIYVYNCVVQGVNCPKSVLSGIKYFEKNHKDIDALLLTRGGGSLEDLMGFSDPKVVEKLNKCKFYTISAIGHEVDNMLSDFVANCRAPTPSVAGKVISEQHSTQLDFITDAEEFLNAKIESDHNHLNILTHKIHRLKDKLPDVKSSIDWEIENLKSVSTHYYDMIKTDIVQVKDSINRLKSRMLDNSHENILEKGYILLVNEDDKIVKTKKRLRLAKKLKMYLPGKELNVKVTIE